MIISNFYVNMFVINAARNGCRLQALNFGALNVVFNIWVEFKKACGNTGRC